jgi:tRNA G18 (ribose-2'-O)-methylase SpoU
MRFPVPVSQRGYFGIGIEHHKTEANIGTLWRSAFTFGASFLFTIARRYQPQASDTTQAWRHIPLSSYLTLDVFWEAIPRDCQVIGIELDARAKPLESFRHPERAVYLLGAEDHGLSNAARERCHRIVQIDVPVCLNVAVAGSIVMYHRSRQRARQAALASAVSTVEQQEPICVVA